MAHVRGLAAEGPRPLQFAVGRGLQNVRIAIAGALAVGLPGEHVATIGGRCDGEATVALRAAVASRPQQRAQGIGLDQVAILLTLAEAGGLAREDEAAAGRPGEGPAPIAALAAEGPRPLGLALRVGLDEVEVEIAVAEALGGAREDESVGDLDDRPAEIVAGTAEGPRPEDLAGGVRSHQIDVLLARAEALGDADHDVATVPGRADEDAAIHFGTAAGPFEAACGVGRGSDRDGEGQHQDSHASGPFDRTILAHRRAPCRTASISIRLVP